MAPAIDPYDKLLTAVSSGFAATRTVATSAQSAFVLSRAWVDRFHTDYHDNPALRLATASRSATVEVVSAVSLGLARPAIFSLRSHYELFTMFLYYRDHPREFTAAAHEIEYMKLPGDTGKYFKKYYKEYDKRWKLLESAMSRPNSDGYGRMSEIVHGSSATAAPSATSPSDVHFGAASLSPMVKLISDVAEELSDIATAVQEGNWMSLPAAVQSGLTARGLELPFKAL